MSSPPLAPAGSSSYNSDTMSVGDGTWDSSRNTFLLPNLVGLNFDTMRYNGMGNRFRELPGYHGLIQAHGVIATITFLFLVPVSILLSRFSTRPRNGIRWHVWLNILTVLLTTVVFILGNIAVGPERRLSNPHHGTGTAIFALVLVAFLHGWWVHRKDWRRKQSYEPLGITLHIWLGWAIALLGLAQIPLGLTLYGSPKVLFILYALAVFALLVVFFILTRRAKRYYGQDYDSRYGDHPSTVSDDHRRRSGSGNWWKAALAGAGTYALFDKFRSKRSKGREDEPPQGPSVVGSHRHSGSFVDDEKYSYYSNDGRWEDRLLKIVAPIGLAGLVTKYYDRKYRDRESDTKSYAPAPGGPGPYADHGHPPPGAPMPPGQPPGQSLPGQPIPSPAGPYNQPYAHPPQGGPIPPAQPLASEHHPLNRTHSRTSSFSSPYSAAQEGRESHGLRDGLATLGALGVAKGFWNRWRGRREERRLEAEREARLHGQRFTGDGRPNRGPHQGMSSIGSETSLSASHPTGVQNIPRIPAGTFAPGTAGAAQIDAERERERRRQEALPLGGVPRPVNMPIIPSDPQGVLHRSSSSSDSYSSLGGRDRRRSRNGRDAVAEGVTPAAVPADVSSSRRDDHQSVSPGGDSGATSPPVRVRVKMHKDGRQVTLSRLPEAEAEARRARNQHNQNDSVSTLSGDGGTGSRFRRREAQERQNAEAMRLASERLAAARNEAQDPNAQPAPVAPANLPVPPPIPENSGPARPSPLAGSVGSPGTYETDASIDYANNRRRRRAERARAKQAKEDREAKTGRTVAFE